MEESYEYFNPDRTSLFELEVNLKRYQYALSFLEGKRVLELGTGSGLATHLFSMVAKEVHTVDYNPKTIEKAKNSYPFDPRKTNFLWLDLEKQEDVLSLPEHDVCVALEVLEHLENPENVLRALKGKALVFSLPLHSLQVSQWHKFPIDTVEDVKRLIGQHYDVGDYNVQRSHQTYGEWVYGYGVRFVSN